MKDNKKCQKSIGNHKLAFFTLNSPHWSLMDDALNFIGDEKLSVDNTLDIH